MLQRAGKLRFQTIFGTLAQSGPVLSLVDDDNRTYVIEAGRMGVGRIDHLIGARVEIKGLVEADPTPRIHVIYLKG
ncbi:MAG: hypothetical protein KF799_15250 [Bdellovibrionales bacterium]|nr:hypothetical protein [Bdellovibrionales bacterium]